jgi:hypothetical protein
LSVVPDLDPQTVGAGEIPLEVGASEGAPQFDVPGVEALDAAEVDEGHGGAAEQVVPGMGVAVEQVMPEDRRSLEGLHRHR